MNARNAFAATLLVVGVAGCQSAPQATQINPATINLADALKQITDALNGAAVNAAVSHQYVGLDICTATVALTLGVTGTSNTKGGGTLSVAVPVIPVSAGISASTEQTLVENRGNVITLNLVTPACNPGGTLGTLNPGKVAQLAAENPKVREEGQTMMLKR